ncbi:MAG: hypothetical protein D6720_08400 [Gammaproteobacteria bacterium]|nr:MAG: hypothetical protein D6720_08400 [Gammaproteobacteria bacterium]
MQNALPSFCTSSPGFRVRSGGWGLALALLWVSLILWQPALAAAGDASGQGISAEAIAAEKTRLEGSSGLSDEQKKQQLALLNEATTLLDKASVLAEEIKQLDRAVREAPRRIAELKKAQPEAQTLDAEVLRGESTEALQARLDKQRQALEQAQQALTTHETALANYLAAAKSGGAELAQVRGQIDALSAPAAGASTAEKLNQAARSQWLKARHQWLKLRQDNLDILIQLEQAERDHAAAQVNVLQANVDLLTRELKQRQVQNLQQAAEQANAQSDSQLPPAVAKAQQRLAALLQEQSQVIARTAAVEQALSAAKSRLDQIQADRQRMEQSLQVAGGAETVSAMLRKRRALLPSPAALTAQIQDYRQRLDAAVLRQLELDEQSRETPATTNQALVAQVQGTDAEPGVDAESAQLRKVERRYRSTLQELVRTYSTYISRLSDLEATLRQLLAAVQAYHALIISKLLWMPSSDWTLWMHPGELLLGLRWLVNTDNVRRLGNDALEAFLQRPLLTALWLVSVLVLFGLRRRALARLAQASELTRRVRTDRFSATLVALAWTTVLILPLPVLVLGAGLLLGSLATAGEYSLRIAAGLQGAGQTLLFFLFFREMCRPRGVALDHFRWHSQLCSRLRGVASWILPLAVPLGFLQAATAAGVPSGFIHLAGVVQTDPPGLSLLGRLSMIVLMVAVWVGIRRIWGRRQAWIQALAASASPPRWVQYHGLWFPLVMLLPLAFAVASALGYDYTAAYFLAIVGETVWFVIGLRMFRDLLLRALYVEQRRIRFEQALQAREASLAQMTNEATQEASPPELPPVDEETIDYGELSGQVRQLVQGAYLTALLIGLWWLWRDVFPALGFLNEIQLPITTGKLVDGTTQEVPLTLGDLFSGLILAGLTFLAARNIPGLLEMGFLQRLPIRPATRYAIVTLTQYTVAMIGLVVVFKAVGLQWSSIQWLVAALSVGLGFGLQEIVANFVSGVILLFEQPIRVGDIVTVDGVTGKVTRIRIRATTILNWERQELVIPNKNFITGQLINWTLSDTVNRVVITVGVAYGSDTRKAMALMAEAAAEHPKVLDEPPPRITFEGFGDNALTLLLRAYLDDVDARLPTITDLHQAINDKFEEAGIVIAFPQRDVHLDTSRPLELVLRRDIEQGKPAR